jgi:hypothetical protein
VYIALFVELSDMKTMPQQDVQVTKSDLQKLSRDFRSVAGRLLRGSRHDGLSNLKRLLRFIEDSPILNDFIQSNQHQQYDIPETLNAAAYGADGYQLPEVKEEEIEFVYQLLKYGESNFDDYATFPFSAGGYTGAGSKIQSQVNEFNKQVVSPFISYIEGYLQGLIIDIRETGQESIHIQIHGDVHGAVMHESQESVTQNNDFRDATIGGGVAARDYSGDVTNHYAQSQTLAEAAAEIQKLLEQLEQTYPTNDFAEKAVVAGKALEQIEANPKLKSKIVGALTGAGKEALKEAVDHPVMNILMAGIEGWQNPG